MTRVSLALLMSVALATTAGAADTSWIERSNRNAQLLLELSAKYTPESAASLGLEGHDADIMDLQPGHDERFQADLASIAQRLEGLRRSSGRGWSRRSSTSTTRVATWTASSSCYKTAV